MGKLLRAAADHLLPEERQWREEELPAVLEATAEDSLPTIVAHRFVVTAAAGRKFVVYARTEHEARSRWRADLEVLSPPVGSVSCGEIVSVERDGCQWSDGEIDYGKYPPGFAEDMRKAPGA